MYFNSEDCPDLSMCKVGEVYLKLAENEAELIEAKKLRKFIFFDEPNGRTEPTGEIDEDEFDDICEHFLVVDGADNDRIVGTYRLLRHDGKRKVEKFYTESEFDISKLKSSNKKLLELGRSCIHPQYRDGKVIQLLWKGIGAFIAHHKLDYLFGCASFQGTDVGIYQDSISYLMHNHIAPEDVRPVALESVRVNAEILDKDKIDRKKAFTDLPTLLKGYIRAGCMVGEGAILDNFCKTIDVCIVMDTSRMAAKYSKHFVEGKSHR